MCHQKMLLQKNEDTKQEMIWEYRIQIDIIKKEVTVQSIFIVVQKALKTMGYTAEMGCLFFSS